VSEAIRIENLTFVYEREAVLQNICATINEGEFIAVIGPNGGGKTTFLKLLLGLLEPTAGRILIYGRSPREASHLIGYTPQIVHHRLDIPLRVREVVLQGRLGPRKFFYTKEDHAVADEAMERLGIAHLAHKRIGDLSGGERQRALIARALACQPKILVMDEPTAALDPAGQKMVYELLRSLDLTRIVVSHDIKILLEGVDRVFYINRELYVHENIDIDLKPTGHFCELDLFEQVRCRHE
jgi:zinc transport system ATP-binding protein